MNTFKIVLGCLLVFILVSGSMVIAQEVDLQRPGDPPDDPEPFVLLDPTFKTRPKMQTAMEAVPSTNPAEITLLIDGVISAQDQTIIEPRQLTDITLQDYPLGSGPDSIFTESAQPVYPIERTEITREADRREKREVFAAGPTIGIAISFDDERWPAVAHGGDYYMVVYSKLGNIYAAVLSNDGILQTTHIVATCLHPALGFDTPSVAYEASSGLFLVAYESFETIPANIRVHAVSPITGAGPSWEWDTPTVDWYPSVACNPDNGSCLVAYQTDFNTMIKGVHWYLDSSGLIAHSVIYNLTNVNDVWYPKVTWGKGTGTYLVTYNWTDSFGEDFPMFTHVYDVPVIGDQWLHGNEYLVSPGLFAGGHGKYNYGSAYDPCTKVFVATLYHHWNGVIYDIWAVPVHGQHAHVGSPFPIALSAADEMFGAISFVTDSHLVPGCGSMDKLVVAYLHGNKGVMAVDLRGNNNPSNPSYSVDWYMEHLVVHEHSIEIIIDSPITISSGSRRAEMMIVYKPYFQIRGDFDVWGRLVEVRDWTYFPLIYR